MLDQFEISQVASIVRHEISDMISAAAQQPGSYHYLCDVGGLVMFTHRAIGTVIRDYG